MADVLHINAVSDREAWLKQRRSYLGGTDMAAIVGMNPYKSPLSVFLSKRGEMDDMSGVKAEMGTVLEPLVKAMFARETGLKVSAAPEHVTHPEYPFLGGNPDGVVSTPPGWQGALGEGILECKTYDYNTSHEWGKPGTEDIPRAYYVQVTWYMGLTGERLCYVAALQRTTGDFGVYPIHFDEETYELLVAEGVRFWNEHILTGDEPQPESTDLDYLRKRYPTDTGTSMIATAEMEKWAEELRDVTAAMKPLEKKAKDLKAKFQKAMGDDSHCETMLGGFSYRKAKDAPATDWESVSKRLLAELATYPGSNAAKLYEHFVTENTEMKIGSRRFLTPFSKEDK